MVMKHFSDCSARHKLITVTGEGHDHDQIEEHKDRDMEAFYLTLISRHSHISSSTSTAIFQLHLVFIMLAKSSFFVGLVALTSANPISLPLEKAVTPVRREVASLCAQYAYFAANGYEFNNNLWGKSVATSGTQCTYVQSTSPSGVAWYSTWTWAGSPDDVKSYVNAGKQFATGLKISNIKSMPTAIQWNYDQTTNVRANVAYDVFTAQDPNHDKSSGDYELMVWLARIGGVYPIGSKIASVNVAGYGWDLYYGLNGSMKVYSFLPANGAWYSSFNADVKAFYNYLSSNQGFPASTQNLIVFQQGTEAFTGGPAKFSVTSYSADINT